MHIPGLVIKRGILMLTKEEFQQKIQEGVHILDGATGSNLRAAGMPKDCCTEQWVLENPEPLVALQRAYAAAGSQIIYAPTFQAQPIALKTVGMDAQTEKINEALVALSRSAAPGCLIAGDLTTLAVYCESWNPDCFDLLVENYRRQIRGLIDGGADLLIGETLLYAQEAEAILTAAELEDGGTVLRDLEAAGAAAVGFNCVAADVLTPHLVSKLRRSVKIPLICKPNAGIPTINDQGTAVYAQTPEEFAGIMRQCRDNGAALLGGCCGTTPAFIAALTKSL